MQKKAKRVGKSIGARAVSTGNGYKNGGSINVIICEEPITNQPTAEVKFSPRENLKFLLLYLWPIKVKYFTWTLSLLDKLGKVRDKR